MVFRRYVELFCRRWFCRFVDRFAVRLGLSQSFFHASREIVEPQAINRFRQCEAGFLQRVFCDPDRRTPGLFEVTAALVDPAVEGDHDIGIAHFPDLCRCFGVVQDKILRVNSFQAGFDSGCRIVIGIHSQFEAKPALRVAGIVEYFCLEDSGVGDAQMIAIQRHQNRRPRRQPDDPPFAVADQHMVVGTKWLPYAQHDA